MPSEPKYSRAISNSTVCTWFYIVAILNFFFAVAGIVGLLYIKNRSLAIHLLIGGCIGFVNAWFLFLVCNRGLHEGFAPMPPPPPPRPVGPPGSPVPNNPGQTVPVPNNPGGPVPNNPGWVVPNDPRYLLNMCETPFAINLISGCTNLKR